MNEFLKIFGKLTIGEIVIVALAIMWIVNQLKNYNHLIEKEVSNRIKQENYEKDMVILKDNMRTLISATGAMLQIRLFSETSRMINQKYLTTEDVELLENLYKSYHALGFNGVGTKAYEECKKLPLKVGGNQ